MAWKELLSASWGAVQSSIALLLVMAYGYASRSLGLLTQTGQESISAIITTLCLPALLYTGIGPSATASTLLEYWTVIVYSVAIQLISLLYALLCIQLGVFESRLWIGACVWNNVISLPLLMMESLSSIGALEGIAKPGSIGEATRRARTYFLINGLVSHIASFVLGPKLMSSKSSQNLISPSSPSPIEYATGDNEDTAVERELAPLLPRPSQERNYKRLSIFWKNMKTTMNPPLFGGLMAVLIGVIPPLHSMFFDKGGFFWGSFTQSLDQVGNLYTSLQILVVGAQLYSSMQTGRQYESQIPNISIFALFLFRFILMPVISISLIYGIRLWKPYLLRIDPMFDFALMIAPVGPPAIHLAAIAVLAKYSEGEKGILSRVLLVSYVVTPFISIPIAAALAVVESEGLVYQAS